MAGAAKRAMVLLGGAALIVAGGAGGYLIAPSGETLATDVSICTNTDRGYAVEYPAAWHTSHLLDDFACELFDPKSFVIPSESDFCCTALVVEARPRSFEHDLEAATDPTIYRVVARADVTVAGLPAVRLEQELVDALLEGPAGTRIYGYIVDRGDRGVISITTYSSRRGPPGYARVKAIVDRAASTLRLF